MKFGMNLLLWTGAMNDDMIPVVASLKEMGYDSNQLYSPLQTKQED